MDQNETKKYSLVTFWRIIVPTLIVIIIILFCYTIFTVSANQRFLGQYSKDISLLSPKATSTGTYSYFMKP